MSPPRERPPVRLHLLLSLSALSLSAALAGCSGGSTFEQPEASSFRAGTCQTVASQVLSIGKDARQLGEDATPAAEVLERLKKAQDALVAIQPTADSTVAEPLGKVVVAVGFVRLRSDGNTYTPDLATTLSAAYDALVTACTP